MHGRRFPAAHAQVSVLPHDKCEMSGLQHPHFITNPTQKKSARACHQLLACTEPAAALLGWKVSDQMTCTVAAASILHGQCMRQPILPCAGRKISSI